MGISLRMENAHNVIKPASLVSDRVAQIVLNADTAIFQQILDSVFYAKKFRVYLQKEIYALINAEMGSWH